MATQNHTITIYGPGCTRCEELELRTRQAVNALSGQYTVRHERDAAAIAAAGILSTPALELDGTVLFSGKVPNLRELQQLLAESAGTATAAAETPTGCACQTSEPTCCCCCKGTDTAPRNRGKRLLLWAVIAVLVIGGIKYMNRYLKAEAPTAPAAAEEPQR